jgi:hypothetical protein
VLISFLLPTMTRLIFSTFPCLELDTGERWLIADKSIDCDSAAHGGLVVFVRVRTASDGSRANSERWVASEQRAMLRANSERLLTSETRSRPRIMALEQWVTSYGSRAMGHKLRDELL